MANIPVSIDARGNLVCNDISGYLDESITWVPDGNSVSSIQSITTTIGSFDPVPSSKNNWTGKIASDGQMPSGMKGVDYTIVVNARDSRWGQKQKSPKITIVVSEPVKL